MRGLLAVKYAMPLEDVAANGACEVLAAPVLIDPSKSICLVARISCDNMGSVAPNEAL
jgi:hypothetical protein